MLASLPSRPLQPPVQGAAPAARRPTTDTHMHAPTCGASLVVSRRLGVMEMSTAVGREAGSQVPKPSGSSDTASGVAALFTFCRTSCGDAPGWACR